ncbi:MAG: SDR family NAD(P)-dependent oxidoreductase, partial [Candidatus Aminicenantes bacterium]
SCRSIDIDYPLPAAANNAQDQIKLLENILETIETPIKTGSDSPGIYIAYRNNRQWVRTYEQAPLEMTGQESLVLKEKGVYLVTGGLGGIGLVLAEYLARTVKARLVLTGRTLFPGRDQWDEWLLSHGPADETAVKIRKIRELEASGAEVLIFQADAANMEQMQHVAARVQERSGKINGIIHAAGVPDGGLIHTRTREMSETVFAPKIKGTLVLDALFYRGSKDKQPDFMVLCSSISSMLSPGGQVAYCAANAFLDAFAFQKAANNTNYTVSINWDSWQEKGMAARAANEHHRHNGKKHREEKICQKNKVSQGINKNGILPAQGVEVFKRVLANRKWPQVIVSTTDFFERTRESRASSPVFFPDELLKASSIPQHPRPELSTRYVAPKNETQQILAQIWQQFLGFQPIGIHDDFFELGGDSLKAMTLSAKIHKALEVEIPLTEFFNRTTIKKLAQYIRGSTSKDNYDSIAPVEEKEYYGLSPAQKRMYVLNQLIRESTVYNIFSVMVLEGEPDRKRLNETTRKLIWRHESLRTSIRVVEEEPVQRIHHEPAFEIESYNSAAGDRSSVIRDLSSKFIRFFDLSRAPLFRVGLAELGEEKYLLVVDMHHIISDGLSQNVLIRDFAALYTGRELQQLPLQYKDFSGWQDNEKRKGILKKQEEYWLKQLEGKIPLLEMPTDFPRPKVHCFEGDTIIFKVDRELTAQLGKLTSETGSTLHIVLLTVFYILLFKYTEQEDIIVGTPIAGRTYPELENIIGMFVNMLVIRSHPGENKTFREFLTEVKENALKAYENQDYPFEELIEKLDLHREPGRHPLIDVVFVLQNMEIPKVEIPGLKLTLYDFERSIAHFDLLLTAFENNDTLDLKLEYSTALFSALTAGRIAKQYIEIIKQAAEDQDIKLKDITITYDLLSAAPGILHDDKDFGF